MVPLKEYGNDIHLVVFQILQNPNQNSEYHFALNFKIFLLPDPSSNSNSNSSAASSLLSEGFSPVFVFLTRGLLFLDVTTPVSPALNKADPASLLISTTPSSP